MENSGVIKQAKSDIFKVMHPIITFYINKGAKPASLKKFYKNNKRFYDLLSDINNKGINLVKDEKEYEKFVREILTEILDDFIAKDKDKEYKNKQESKMKHIKEFCQFDIITENKSNINQFGESELRKYLNLPKECKVEILKGDIDAGVTYKKFIKYIILNLPFPVDDYRSKIIKKVRENKPDEYYSHAVPNFGKGVNWIVKY